ncbi:MAG TPA: polysaccharide biosynthesis tyrosine autokinase [Alloacidobacterium sp.]|nr:polysaccharide biosynthesis tyrosine autokinase [Alloacidobacterium sp.]
MQTAPRVTDLRAVRDGEWTLAAFVSLLRRRRAAFLCVFAAFVAAATLYCIFATRRYQAVGQIQIQKDNNAAFGLETSVMGDAPDNTSDSLDYNLSLQTEVGILNSESLALQVIHDLHLETTADFYPPSKSAAPGRHFWKKPVEPISVPLEHAPNRRYTVLKIFASRLKVEPVAGTRLINISYSNPDPVLAADVVNHLIRALMEYSFRARFDATAEASTWLTAQLGDLRKQTEALQQKAILLQRETGMFGDDESHNVMLARLEDLNAALASAESNRILMESIDRIASSGDPEMIAGLSNTLTAKNAALTTNSLSLIQNLRAQQAAVRAELDQDRVRYGSAYPRIAELQAELESIETSIHDEVRRIGQRAHTDYQVAVKNEIAARAAFEEQKKLVNNLNDKATAYRLAKQEADGSREVYESLLAKLKQAGVLEGLRSTNISIVSPARVPAPNHPKSPNIPLYYAAACGIGLIFSIGAAFFRDLTDSKLRTLEELEALTGAPVLGLIPANKIENHPSIIPLKLKSSSRESTPFAEPLRALRTSLLPPHGSNAPQVILFTSAHTGEGKSTVSCEFATVLARQGSRVLLVDADLRRPILHQRLKLSSQDGLSEALRNGHAPSPQHIKSVPGLHIVCGGTVPPFPADLLGSHKMRSLISEWRNEYEFVVLDGPPILPVTDSVVLSRLCDAVLLVARHSATEKKAVQRSYQTLLRQLPEGVSLGTVLNAVPPTSSAFLDYYGKAAQ